MTLISAGCGLDLSAPEAATSTAFIITSTLPPTTPPAAAVSPIAETPVPSPVPIEEGTTSTQVNVRGQPSTASPTLGILPAFAKVQILGRDAGGNWYQIVYAAAPEGRGWVSAQYIQVAAGVEIPLLGGATGGGSGPSGVAVQQVNIRSGPGTGYDSIGTLNPRDVFTLTAKDANAEWLQILFPPGPDGKGWVKAAFVQADGIESLPIVNEAGAVVGTGTPAPAASLPAPTIVAAFQDGDSAGNPGVNVTFSAEGTRALIYSGDLSAPEGDAEDWIRFQPYGKSVLARLTCEGNGTLTAEILQAGGAGSGLGLACGDEGRAVSVSAGQAYIVHLRAAQPAAGLQYIRYTLSIESLP